MHKGTWLANRVRLELQELGGQPLFKALKRREGCPLLLCNVVEDALATS